MDSQTDSIQLSDPSAWKSLTLTIGSAGHLCVSDANGVEYIDVRPVRLFPLSVPDRWIALFDSSGREIACVNDPSELSEPSRMALERELEKREFVPKILRILWVSGNSEPCEWKVETDRGNTSFILKDEKDVRRLGEDGVLVLDSHGIRYLIPNRRSLDGFSRRVVEWYV